MTLDNSELEPRVRIATGQPKRWKVIARMPSYHGGTYGALAVTGAVLLALPGPRPRSAARLRLATVQTIP